MPIVTTARLFANQALQLACGQDCVDSAAIDLYGAERLRIALNGGEDMVVTLRVLRDICIARGYKELYEFYMLSFAYERLQTGDEQFYWPDATLENIFTIVRNEAEKLATKVERTA